MYVENKPRRSFSAIISFSLFLQSPRVRVSHDDFYFVISKNDSQGDAFGQVCLVGYWVDSTAACFAVCANSCCRARQVWFVMHFFPGEKNTKYT